jgi:uncharacterized membrane protein YidH (DUF202 family)
MARHHASVIVRLGEPWEDARMMDDDPDRREFGEGSRRTYLAAERTYLSWIRSGLAALAVAIGVGRLIPALLETDRAVFALLGVGYAVLGLGMMLYGGLRQRSVRRAIDRGRYVEVDQTVVLAISSLGVVLAVATILVVVMEL